MKIVWTKQAIADLNHAYNYLSEHSPKSDQDIIKRIEKSLEALRSFPEMGRKGRVREIRELVVSKDSVYSALSRP